MELIYLKLKNFLSYKEQEIDFSNINYAVVVGDNGAGKSSILEAILWSLYGEASKGSTIDINNFIKKGETEASVEFIFRIKDNTYKIIRSRTTEKSTLRFFILDGDNWVELTRKTIQETQRLISNTIKISYKALISSSIAIQGETDMFTSMTDIERKEVLSEILGLNIWDDLLDFIKNKIRVIEDSLLTKETLKKQYQNEISNEATLKEKYEKIKTETEQLNSDIEKLNTELKKIQNIIDERAKIENAYNLLEKDYVNIKSLIMSNKAKIKSLLKKIAEKEEIIRQISVDSQKISEMENSVRLIDEFEKQIKEYDEKMIAHISLEKNLSDLILDETKLKEQLKSTENVISILKDKIKESDKIPCSNERYVCPLFKSINDTINTIDKETINLEEIKRRLLELEKAKQNIKLEIEKLDYSKQKHDELKVNLEKLRKIAKEYEKIKSNTERVEEIMQYIKEMQIEIEDIEKTNEVLDNQLEIIEQNKLEKEKELKKYPERSKIEKEIQKIQRHIELLTKNKEQLILEQGKIEQTLNRIVKIKDELSKINSEISGLVEKMMIYGIIEKACNKKSGVPAFILENVIPEIEQIANKYLSDFTQNRLQINIQTTKKTKSGDYQDVLRIIVLDKGIERDYKTFSGAEKFLIDLSLRVALAKFLPYRANSEIRTFVLDEGLGVCDDSNKQTVINALESLSNEFSKVIIITHIPEIQDVVPQKIKVYKENEQSKVKIVTV